MKHYPPQELRVLSIEDNAADSILIATAFEECGYAYQLTCCQSRSDARPLLAERSFDLVLLDLGSDGQEAAQFLRWIRSDYPQLPVVVLSGMVNPLPAYAAGAHAFVRKMNDWNKFVDKIRGVLHFWVEIAELPALVRKQHAPDAGRSRVVFH